MADNSPTDEELGIPEGLDPNIRAELRRSRELARDLDTERAARATADRELAFAKAGIPDTPLAQQLSKGYEGENTPEAVRAYFDGLGVDLGAAPGATSAQEDADLEAQRRVAQVGSQGEPGGDVSFDAALKSAKNPEEVMALIASAPAGATTMVNGQARRIGVPSID